MWLTHGISYEQTSTSSITFQLFKRISWHIQPLNERIQSQISYVILGSGGVILHNLNILHKCLNEIKFPENKTHCTLLFKETKLLDNAIIFNEKLLSAFIGNWEILLASQKNYSAKFQIYYFSIILGVTLENKKYSQILVIWKGKTVGCGK